MSERHVALLCFYDPAGVHTVVETIAYLQSLSRHGVHVVNLFHERFSFDDIALKPTVDFDQYDAIVLHNTLAYNVENLRTLDRHLRVKLRQFGGTKILMKQDENFRFRELAHYIGDTGFDVIFTCLPPEAIAQVYPPQQVGSPRFIRMLTGYVTPQLRARTAPIGTRPVDIFYRGSVQPLSFGRLAYEKRAIGEEVRTRLCDAGLVLDISSRWEDRVAGEAWFAALGNAKVTLGAESGASIFDLDDTLAARCAQAEQALGPMDDSATYAEAYLQFLAPLENDVRYHQIAPRHFEAVAMRTVQWLLPGEYSGILQPHRHYFPLARDFSNLPEALALLSDPARCAAMTEAAYHEIILNPDYAIERFVTIFDAVIAEGCAARPHQGCTRLAPRVWRMRIALTHTAFVFRRAALKLLPLALKRWLHARFKA